MYYNDTILFSAFFFGNFKWNIHARVHILNILFYAVVMYNLEIFLRAILNERNSQLGMPTGELSHSSIRLARLRYIIGKLRLDDVLPETETT